MVVAQPTFRDRARASVEPLARVLGRLGLTPNSLTLIGFAIAAVAAVAAAAQMWLPAALLVAVGASFDMLDGALARATGRLSRLGAFLDSTIDRAGEAVVYVGIGWACLVAEFRVGALLAMAAMASAFMVSYTRARAESLGFTSGKGLANVGLAPREARVVILVIGLLLVGLSGGLTGLRPFADLMGNIWLIATLGLITILATITTIQRIVHVYLQAKKEL
jgi:CDP-diacylglycerol---glycerol-3-phosphate 3-phosphatidyltransferase